MEKIDWQVEGMTCSNCALSISKYLKKEGMEDVRVNPLDGTVSFQKKGEIETDDLKKGISQLGYKVKGSLDDHHGHAHDHEQGGWLSNSKRRFFFCLPFTLILMLHMVHEWISVHWLMNPWVQLALCLPVFIVGMRYFGKSAFYSIKGGVPNMDVLITLGALSAFIYSLTGAILGLGDDYLFFETTASIITLVFLGNYLEESSVKSTQKAIRSLARSQEVMANMIAFDHEHKEQVFEVASSVLKNGDLILIRTGEQVPADCKILWGDCSVNEAIITGESIPLLKQKKDRLIGGSVIESGLVKAQVTAAGKDTVLSGILEMVRNAQSEKPPMQKLADKISAIFVPLVIGIAVLTFVFNYMVADIAAGDSLMRAIAVLVISCPCAMGLATPAAIAVGLGRAAKNGILFRNASALERFKEIRQVVFDKTGTLTTGKFSIENYHSGILEDEFKRIVYSIEKYSTHPIATSVAEEWKTNDAIQWQKIEEVKGYGMIASDKNGNNYKVGSFRILDKEQGEDGHHVYVARNEELIGWIDVKDQIREEAVSVIRWLHGKNIRTILLSGDRLEKSKRLAKEAGIDVVFAEQTPEQKLQKIEELNREAPTAMVGDGINDAPALAKASLGISLSDASQIALQSADVILMNYGLKNLPMALGLGKHTFLTIRQNLFWAFAYNIVAIPIAALGFLTPTFSALAMGLSDVVLALNSLKLFVKKVL